MTSTTRAPARTSARVNVGCGRDVIPGWINLDKSPSVFLARVPRFRAMLGRLRILTPAQAEGLPPGVQHADATRRLPLDDGTAGFVYSSHMIEHLARWQGERFAAECFRVLEPGGLLRLATPDLRVMAQEYLDGSVRDDWQTPADAFVAEFGAYHDVPANWIRRFVRRSLSGAIHQWLYDAESLGLLLREAGFVDVIERGYRDGDAPDLELIEHRPRSLFIEARKPSER